MNENVTHLVVGKVTTTYVERVDVFFLLEAIAGSMNINLCHACASYHSSNCTSEKILKNNHHEVYQYCYRSSPCWILQCLHIGADVFAGAGTVAVSGAMAAQEVGADVFAGTGTVVTVCHALPSTSWASRKLRLNKSVRREFFDVGKYTPVSGTPITCIQATIDKSVQRLGNESNVPLNHDEISFLKIDIPNAKRGDTFNDGTTTYTFVSVLVDDDAIPVWLVTS